MTTTFHKHSLRDCIECALIGTEEGVYRAPQAPTIDAEVLYDESPAASRGAGGHRKPVARSTIETRLVDMLKASGPMPFRELVLRAGRAGLESKATYARIRTLVKLERLREIEVRGRFGDVVRLIEAA